MIDALRILHIAIAAAWFGHKLLIPGDIHRSAAADPSQAQAMIDRLKRAERLGKWTGVGTLLSGGALLWAVGVDEVGIGVWVGLGLVICAIALGATTARTASNHLREAVTRGDRVGATIAGGRLSRVLGMESLLWVGALTAMVV